MNAVATSILGRILGNIDGHAISAATLRVLDRGPRFRARCTVLACTSILISINEFKILIFLGGHLDVVNREG